MAPRQYQPSSPFSALYITAASQYIPIIGVRVRVTENEANELVKQRSELIAQLRAPLRAEQAAYRQAAADLEEGELPDPQYRYISGPSLALDSRSQSTGSSKSKIPVYKDPASLPSSKRKVDDEGDAPKAKRQHQASSHVGPDVTRQAEQEDSLDATNAAPIGEGPGQRVSTLRKDVERYDVSYGRLVLQDKQPSNDKANKPREQASNISKTKPGNTSREVGTRAEARNPIRPPAPTVASPLPPRPTALASSAFSQLGARNAKIAKEERTRFEAEEKLQNLEHEKTPIGRVDPKSRVTKPQTTKVSKAKPLASANAAPLRKYERTPDYAYSISTGAPPQSTAPKPTTSPEHEAASETMISGQVGSIQKKRKAEEDLESLNTKAAKQDKGPFSEDRPAGPKRAVAPAKDLTDHEAIFGKGSKPRRLDIQKIPVQKSNGPVPKPRPVPTDEHMKGIKYVDEKSRDNQPSIDNAARKRKLEAEASSDRPSKQARITEPKGLRNFRRACFANAPLQCLLGVPELADHYEAFASGLVPEVEEVVARCPDLDQRGRTSREVGGQRHRVRKSFEEHKEEISLSAYLGDLVHKVATEEEPTPSPFKFLQAFGTLSHDDGNPLNGETSQDAKQFVDELLTRLQEEELEQAVLGGHMDSTLVQEMFGVKTSKHLYCAACEFSKDEDIVVDTSIDVVLPRNKATTTLAKLLKSTGTGHLLADYKCPNPSCNVRNRTVERYQLEGTSKYLIVQVPRVGEKLDKEGRIEVSDKGKLVPAKIHDEIQFPKDVVDLSTLMPENQRMENANYELFGMVMHRGINHYDGHYMALRKVNGQWWECNDERVTAIAHEDLSDYDNGQIFFLKRVD